MKYKLTVLMKPFVKVKENYDYVEIKKEFEFDWETLVSFLGCIVDSSVENNYKFEIVKVEEESNG